MVNIGPLELLVVLIIALVVLGPQRLPEVARSVGKGMREFRSAVSGEARDDEDDVPEPTAELEHEPELDDDEQEPDELPLERPST
jgi:sec-independent protein translocase protein TatA